MCIYVAYLSFLLKFLLNFFCVLRGMRKVRRQLLGLLSLISSSGIEFRLSGLKASPFLCYAILPVEEIKIIYKFLTIFIMAKPNKQKLYQSYHCRKCYIMTQASTSFLCILPCTVAFWYPPLYPSKFLLQDFSWILPRRDPEKRLRNEEERKWQDANQ